MVAITGVSGREKPHCLRRCSSKRWKRAKIGGSFKDVCGPLEGDAQIAEARGIVDQSPMGDTPRLLIRHKY